MHSRASFLEAASVALDSLRSSKLRSFLTLLGIILAVVTLVGVISVTEGLNRYVADKLANIGANVFVVNQMGIITSFEEFIKAQRRPPVTYEDFQYLKEHLKLAHQVAAADDKLTNVRYGNETLEDVVLLGVSANYAEMRGLDVVQGRNISEADDEHRSPVVFVGADVAKRFFTGVDPVGKSLRVGSQAYEIVGVAKAQGTVLGQSRDNFVNIPMGSYLKNWLRGGDSIFMLVQAPSPELMDAAQDEARAMMRARRHLSYTKPDNFGVIAPSSITNLWERLTSRIFAMAVGLTSVFLLVGAIVVMNIMLASVVERTREIGIRKALGARRRHIVMQFLVEAMTLTAIGGIVGIVLAIGLSALVRAAGLPTVTPLYAVVLALALSTGVGLFFGIYPAVRASRLDPIEALRQEV